MNASNRDYIILHADAEWMKDILKRIQEILDKDPINIDDIKAAQWLIKQALKVEKENDTD